MDPVPHAVPSLPDAVIATRPDASSPWRTGSGRSATDLHWRIRTIEEDVLRTNHTATVRFDTLVAPGLRLNDPVLADDRRVKNELCLDALSPTSRAGRLSAPTLAKRLNRFDKLLRWRLEAAIPSFSALDVGHLHRFLRQTGGRERSGSDEGALQRSGSETSLGNGLVKPSRAAGGSAAREARTEQGLVRESGHCPSEEPRTPVTRGSSVSEQTIVDNLAVWSWLWRAAVTGVTGANRLAFDPCPEGAASRLASAYGTQGARTPTLRPEQFLRVLGVSCAWVRTEGPAVLALMADDSGADAAAPRAFLAGCAGDAVAASLATRVRHLMAACAAVIGGFAARRGGEVGSLKAGCIKRRRGAIWLSVYIEKTDRAVRLVPVPESVALAVETLEALSSSYRLRTGEPWIFNALLPGCEKPLSFLSDNDLPAFALACGLHSGPHALTSPLASHQLRRGFSIAFYHAFRLGSLPALRRMLRHADDASTRIYVSEATPGGTLRLADDLRARFHAALKAMPPGRQVALSAELDRLETLAASGTPLDLPRCEHAALLLLRAWQRDMPPPERPAADETQAAERRAVAGIRIGSQLASGPSHSISLLDRARAYALRVLVR